MLHKLQVAELASLAQLLPPCSPTCVIRRRTALVRADCVRFSCCSPIALIRFNCCSPFASASAAARHLCLSFSCYSPIASVSTAPRLRSLRLLLLNCVHRKFNCCSGFTCSSPIACASAAAPRLRPLNACSLTCSGRFQPMPNVLERSPRSSRTSHFHRSHTQSLY